jgi:hypothetical protein
MASCTSMQKRDADAALQVGHVEINHACLPLQRLRCGNQRSRHHLPVRFAVSTRSTSYFVRWAAGYPYDSSRGKVAQSVTPQRLEYMLQRCVWMRSTANTSPTSWLSVLSGVPNIARRCWLVRSPRSLPQRASPTRIAS